MMIGQRLVERFWKDKKDSLVWSSVVGVPVSWIVFGIPVLGWLFSLVAIWWGLGGTFLNLKAKK